MEEIHPELEPSPELDEAQELIVQAKAAGETAARYLSDALSPQIGDIYTEKQVRKAASLIKYQVIVDFIAEKTGLTPVGENEQ